MRAEAIIRVYLRFFMYFFAESFVNKESMCNFAPQLITEFNN